MLTLTVCRDCYSLHIQEARCAECGSEEFFLADYDGPFDQAWPALTAKGQQQREVEADLAVSHINYGFQVKPTDFAQPIRRLIEKKLRVQEEETKRWENMLCGQIRAKEQSS